MPWSKAGQSLNVAWGRGDALPATSKVGASVGRYSPSTHDLLVTVSQIAASGERMVAEVSKKKDEVEFGGKTGSFCILLCYAAR